MIINKQTTHGNIWSYATLIFLFLLAGTLIAQPKYRIEEANLKAESFKKAASINSVMTANQSNYDVKHYLIDIDFNPAQQEIYGMVQVTAEVTGESLSKVDLDLSFNMLVDSVIANSINSTYNRSGDVLTVNLNKEYLLGETISIMVYYQGSPEASGLGSFGFDSYRDKPLIWSLSEPYGAREWWPCKDAADDKADSVDIKFTVPEGMVAASNGKLISETSSNGKTTFWWKTNYPISSYLISIAAYEYTHYTDQYIAMNGDTMSLDFFVAPNHYENSLYTFPEVKDMISVFANLFGEYPFIKDKYGHAEFPWGGGMEHQTITSLGNIHNSSGLYSRGLIAHELAHQWWGDMITCRNFKHIWINEGFATYSEALIIEAVYGFEEYKEQMKIEEYYGPGSVFVEDSTNVNRIFSAALSYSKGAYVLHMLRNVVGDDLFFEILRTYGNDPRFKYGNADTEDFRGVCESVSGMNLEKFFDQWIYGEYYPQYSYGYTVDSTADGYNLNLTIDQTQTNTGLFWMPIDIRITTASGSETYTVWDSLQTQSFTINLDEEPVRLEFDPDNWILKNTREKLLSASLDKGTLLVNGLDWGLGNNIYSSFESKGFWGDAEVTFWDLFETPQAGYPDALPEPLGQGELTISTMAQYSTIIWVSHNYGGDLYYWQKMHISDYLSVGGNVILITRMGREFLDPRLTDYLGIEWNGDSYNITKNCVSAFESLTDMNYTSQHTLVSLFDTELTKDYSTLLFKTDESLDQEYGLGVWANPPDGGQFVYIAARPHLIEPEALRQNLQYIATELFDEAVGVKENTESKVLSEYRLEQNYPNPFNPATKIKYTIPEFANVRINVFNILGEKVSTLVNQVHSPGNYEVSFDASDLTTDVYPVSGVYFYELIAGNFRIAKKMILLR